MDKYVVISDPIRSKQFAIVGDMNGSIVFKAFNEVAKQWANENSSAKSLNSIKVPDGMHVSSHRRMTTSISLIFDSESSTEVKEVQNSGVDVSHNRKINKISEKVSVNNIQIRKVSNSTKTRLIDYKAKSFKSRARRSSVISAVRSGVGRLNKKSMSFSSKHDPGIDVLSKTAGTGFVRRIAVSNFAKKHGNRLERRASSLTIPESYQTEKLSPHQSIDAAISSKAKRFI